MGRFKFLAISILLFLGLSVEAQIDTLNRTDEKGQKQGYWIFYGSDFPDKGYPAHGKVEEGTYLDDRKEGTWIKYHRDGKTPKLKGQYKNNRPHGYYEKFYDNGALRESGYFENNQLTNELYIYYKSGCLWQEKSHDANGKQHGVMSYYYDDCGSSKSGQLEYTQVKNHGVDADTSRRYYENGDLKVVCVYNEDGSINSQLFYAPIIENQGYFDDVFDLKPDEIGYIPKNNERGLEGQQKLYNEEDELWMDGVFRDGRLWDGELYLYDEKGNVLKKEIWKEGEVSKSYVYSYDSKGAILTVNMWNGPVKEDK